MSTKELFKDLWDKVVERHRSGDGYENISKTLNIPWSAVKTIIKKLKACSSFKVAIDLLVASLISLLLTCSSILEGRPDLGRVLVVPYAFHFLMIVLTVFQGIFKAFEIFLYPSPDVCLSTTLSSRSFESSLVLMVESLL